MNDVTRDRSVKNHTQRSRHSWIGVIPPVDITREDTKTDPKTFRDTFRNSARNVASTEVTNETFRENKKKMIHYRIDPTPRSKTIFYKTKKATLCGFRPNWGRSNEKKNYIPVNSKKKCQGHYYTVYKYYRRHWKFYLTKSNSRWEEKYIITINTTIW